MRLLVSGVTLFLLLAGCSQTTRLGARFVDGRLAFVALDGEVGCIRDIAVRDVRSGKIMWQVPYLYDQRACTGGVPIFYGHLPGRGSRPAAPVLADAEYEISGSAEGSNDLSDRFRITRVHGVQLGDVLPAPCGTSRK